MADFQGPKHSLLQRTSVSCPLRAAQEKLHRRSAFQNFGKRQHFQQTTTTSSWGHSDVVNGAHALKAVILLWNWQNIKYRIIYWMQLYIYICFMAFPLYVNNSLEIWSVPLASSQMKDKIEHERFSVERSLIVSTSSCCSTSLPVWSHYPWRQDPTLTSLIQPSTLDKVIVIHFVFRIRARQLLVMIAQWMPKFLKATANWQGCFVTWRHGSRACL